MLKEFREFIARGNVLDLAVAVVIGAAFGKIVTTFVDGIIMPIIGLVTGGVNFTDKFVNLSSDPKYAAITSLADAKKAGAPVIAYGALINDIVNFIIVALVIFLIVKGYNAMRKKEEAAPAGPTTTEVLLADIRDLLRQR